MSCPNINDPRWKELVGKIGIYKAFSEFVRHGEQIPDPGNYAPTLEGVNYGLQIINALLQPPVEGWFERFYKKEKRPDVFFRKLQQTRAPKEQIELLKDWLEGNTAPTLNDVITGLISEMSFVVSIDTSVYKPLKYFVYDDWEDYIVEKESHPEIPEPEYRYAVMEANDRTRLFRTNSLEEAEAKAQEMNSQVAIVPTQYYENLGVLGGTNYREVEVRTPAIQPVTQGHGRFSTPYGIGWFRADDKIPTAPIDRFKKEFGVEGEYEDITNSEEFLEWIQDNREEPKTRRIFEIQSDLFQKSQGEEYLAGKFVMITSQELINKLEELSKGKKEIQFGDFLYQKRSALPHEFPKFVDTWFQVGRVGVNPENNFLQLLMKDNNWVKFFIRSIIQDSARKDYRRVLFPAKNTVAKIQKHVYVSYSVTSREHLIAFNKELLSRLEAFLKEPLRRGENSAEVPDMRVERKWDGSVQYYISKPDGSMQEVSKERAEEILRDRIDSLKRETAILEREVADIIRGHEEMRKFARVGKFYEEEVYNILRKQGYKPNRIKDVFGHEWFEVNIEPKMATSPILLQKESPKAPGKSTTIPGKASPRTLKILREFLERARVDVRAVEGITINGQKTTIQGIADAIKGLVVVVNGKEDVALPEEAMHIAVEIVRQTNPKLFKEMMDKIGTYNIFSEVVAEYKNIPFYKTKDGKPDIPKLKQEAIAKVLARVILDQAGEVNERPDFLVRTRTWWEKILDWLKTLFGRTGMDPFEFLASEILAGRDIGSVDDLRESAGEFAQVGSEQNDELYDKLQEVHRNLAKTEEGYELNGEKIRRTVMGEVEDFYAKRQRKRTLSDIAQANQEFREETEGNAKLDIQSILDRYIDDDGQLRESPLEQTVPSAIDPYNSTFYNTLEGAIAERLRSYPAGTRFLKDINVLDDKTGTAATIDLMAILPDEQVDVLQFKVPGLTGLRRDIPTWVQEAYNIEIEGIRKILQNGYGVPRSRFRMTRAIPIRANYEYNIPSEPRSGLKVISVTIGGLDATLIQDDVLLPVPSLSETTGEEQFDRFLARLRGLVTKLADERVPPDKRLEKGQRIAQLVAAIRKLQVQRKAEEIISSARTIIRRQQEVFDKLQQKIADTDPQQASIEELNQIADEIMSEKDQMELYVEMNKVFREVFTSNSDQDKSYIEEGRKVSDDAQDMLNRYWKMAIDFRKTKMAAKMGIRDEFTPEKQLSWYRRLIRSLSQSSTRAGAMLWGLVKNINNRMALEFRDRLGKLKELEDAVDKWRAGRPIQEVYKRILHIDKDGRWNGRFIQRYAKEFYTELKEAQEKRNLKWVWENIDIDAYKAWYLEEHKRLVENAKTTRVHEDDAENARRIQQSLQDFVNTYSITTSRGVNRNNYRLKDFPLPKWESEEYKELTKPENKALLDLYNYWIDRLEESLESGMIDEHNGWSWFPNVRRNMLEKLTTAPGKGKIGSIFGGLRIEKEDTSFGKIDPLTGKPMDEIHASFVSDLGEWVKGTDGNYFLDYSEKSMDIFKVMALWEREIVKYKLKTESEAMARLLHYTEENRTAYKTKRTGGIDRDENGYPIIVSNEINARYLKEHIDAVYYNKNLSDESDVAFELPYGATVNAINKLAGRKILDEPEEKTITISGVKALAAINRFYVAKTLGLNVFTSLSNLFGGTVNTYINQGRYFTKKDILESELLLVSGRFYGPLKDKVMAGLLAYLHPYTDDITSNEIRNLSVSRAVRWLSADRLFVLQRASEMAVNSVIAMSILKNAAVIDGKIVNIREHLRKEMGYENKYSGTYEDAQAFEKELDRRVEEMQNSPQALLNYARVEDDQIVIPGLDRYAPTILDLRELMLQVSRQALGNTAREDLSLYKRSIMWQSFFMFKNWIPRMVDVRFQSLKYNPGTQSYEWGRFRMLGDSLRRGALNNIRNLTKYMSGSSEPLIDIARKAYKDKQREFVEQEDRLDMSEAEFIDMYIKGVRSEAKELLLALSLMGIMVAARAGEPDEGDPEVKGLYKWMLRGLDKLQDEVSFFYNPISFTNIVNGSVFPAVHLLVELERFIGTGILKGWYTLLGDEEGQRYAEDLKPSKYLFRMLPITKELLTYLAIFNEDIAREYNIRIQSRYGMFR